jgi:hypothetical protein
LPAILHADTVCEAPENAHKRWKQRQTRISRDEYEGNFLPHELFCNNKTFFPEQSDIEQHEIRRARGYHLQRRGNVAGGSDGRHAKAGDGLGGVHGDQRIVLNHEDVGR